MIGLRSFGYALVFAVLLASTKAHGQEGEPQAGPPARAQQNLPSPTPANDPHAAEERAAERQALGFMQYLDQGRYADSYAYTSGLLRARLTREQFTQEVRKDRESAGAEVSRKLLNASYTKNLNGQPAGQYVVLQYNSDFKIKTGAIETVVLSHENGYWRVAGWYIK